MFIIVASCSFDQISSWLLESGNCICFFSSVVIFPAYIHIFPLFEWFQHKTPSIDKRLTSQLHCSHHFMVAIHDWILTKYKIFTIFYFLAWRSEDAFFKISKLAIRIQKLNILIVEREIKTKMKACDAIVLSHWHINCIFKFCWFSQLISFWKNPSFMIWNESGTEELNDSNFNVLRWNKREKCVKISKWQQPRAMTTFIVVFMGCWISEFVVILVTVTSDCIEWFTFYRVSYMKFNNFKNRFFRCENRAIAVLS